MTFKIETAYKKIDKLTVNCEKNKYITNYFGAWGNSEFVDSSIFDELTTLSFEGRRVFGPLKYDSYLTQIYGDYLSLPPLEKQIPHHFVYKIDLEIKKDNE
jgi:lipopolysaccharide cholinephosphotransferase